MKIFQILARPFIAFVERYYPDAFIFVIILSVITFISALILTEASVSSALLAWGDGLSMLFTFTAQITIIMIGAHSLAHTTSVQNFLTRIGQLPNTAYQAYSLVAFTAGVASLCAWSFGLIIGAIMARSVAKECLKKPFKIHYPLLVASAYSGYVIWHMGYSSSSALFVATPGHLLENKIGVLPVTETILSPINCSIQYPKDWNEEENKKVSLFLLFFWFEIKYKAKLIAGLSVIETLSLQQFIILEITEITEETDKPIQRAGIIPK